MSFSTVLGVAKRFMLRWHVYLSDVDCRDVRELPIMCSESDFCLQDYDVILPAAALGNLQAKAVISKGLCNGPTVRKRQPCVNLTTPDRLSSGTKMAVGSKTRSSHTDRQPKRNLGCGMIRDHPVVKICILCVALIVCIALCFVTDNYDVIFARVLTPAPVMLSCLSLSQRFEDDNIAHLQPDQRQELRQLLDEFADQFDDRSGRCDAVVHQIQDTDGLVRWQMQPCREPDVCSVTRPIRPSNSPMVRLIIHVFATRTYPYGETKKDGGVCVASDYGYLNSDTVGDVFLMPTTDEVLRNIDKRHIM